MFSLLALPAEAPIRLPGNHQANKRDSSSYQDTSQSHNRRQHRVLPPARRHGLSSSHVPVPANTTTAIRPGAHLLSSDSIALPSPTPPSHSTAHRGIPAPPAHALPCRKTPPPLGPTTHPPRPKHTAKQGRAAVTDKEQASADCDTSPPEWKPKGARSPEGRSADPT